MIEYLNHVMSPYQMRVLTTPAQVKNSVHNCHLCPLQQYHKPLKIEGNNQSLMIIGQDPNDVLSTTPQGKMLRDLLSQLHFDLEDIYFTSAVKCVGSIYYDHCNHHVVSEIHFIKPDVIIAMGYYAAKPFLEHLVQNQLSPGHGATLPNGSDIIATNQLQEAYQNDSLYQQLQQHFQLVKTRLEQRRRSHDKE